MSPLGRLARRAGWRFPRVSGDEPRRPGVVDRDLKFSPRERG